MLNVELAISNVQEALRGKDRALLDDFAVLAMRARRPNTSVSLDALAASIAANFFRPDMTSIEMADAAMQCNRAARLLRQALDFEDKPHGTDAGTSRSAANG